MTKIDFHIILNKDQAIYRNGKQELKRKAEHVNLGREFWTQIGINSTDYMIGAQNRTSTIMDHKIGLKDKEIDLQIE